AELVRIWSWVADVVDVCIPSASCFSFHGDVAHAALAHPPGRCETACRVPRRPGYHEVPVPRRRPARLELKINGDVSYEHFFFVDSHFEANVFVPTVGVIARL